MAATYNNNKKSSSIFDKAFDLLMKFEGGYVHDPNDPGGETKYGISKRRYPDLDIKNLTIDEAKELYRRDYWDKLNADKLPAKVAIFSLQCAVNNGVVRTARMIQAAARYLSGYKLKLDGIIGPKSLKAIYYCNEDELVSEIATRQLLRYVRIIRNNPALSKFIKGWFRRVVYSLKYVLTCCGEE